MPVRKLMLFSALILLLFASCTQDAASLDEKLVTVSISTLVEKVLTVSDGASAESLSYFYTATPNFSGHCKGKTTEPVQINLTDGSAELGEFSQGSWTFSIYAKEGDNTVLSGSVTSVLSSEKNNTVTINLTREVGNGNGTLRVSLTCPYLGEGTYSLAMRYKKVSDGTYTVKDSGWAILTGQSGVSYIGSMTLASGSYELNFVYMKDGQQLGGETVTATVCASATTVVEGSIESGINAKAGVSVNVSLSSPGKYTGSGYTYSGLEKVFYWNNQAGVGEAFSWKLNGTDLDCHTGSYSFCETVTGDYTLECFAQTSSGLQCSSYTVTVKEPNTIKFGEMRSGSSSESQVCIGYKNTSNINVDFPYLFRGDVDSTKKPSDYGLTPVFVDCTVKTNVSSAKYIEVNREWDRSSWGSYLSVVGSNLSNKNYSLEEALIKANLSTNALAYCRGLTNVVFAGGVTSIPGSCCNSDVALSTVWISKDVTTVSSTAFNGCTALKCIYLEKGSSLTRETLGVSSSVSIVTGCEGIIFR